LHAVSALDGGGYLLFTVSFASNQGAGRVRDHSPAGGHDFTADKPSLVIMNNIKLVKLSTDDTAVHFTNCMILRHGTSMDGVLYIRSDNCGWKVQMQTGTQINKSAGLSGK
jgi:hypothetical protein